MKGFGPYQPVLSLFTAPGEGEAVWFDYLHFAVSHRGGPIVIRDLMELNHASAEDSNYRCA